MSSVREDVKKKERRKRINKLERAFPY
ncbi:hypothetical protein Hamer_G026846, partial [Homarus americanus]